VPGKHLVFVKYAPGHCFCDEWVFNSADLKSQRIVYARPVSPESDQGLAEYLSEHDIWVVEPDAQPYRLARLSTYELANVSQSGEDPESLQ
jgi:hypothetical protein